MLKRNIIYKKLFRFELNYNNIENFTLKYNELDRNIGCVGNEKMTSFYDDQRTNSLFPTMNNMNNSIKKKKKLILKKREEVEQETYNTLIYELNQNTPVNTPFGSNNIMQEQVYLLIIFY